MGFDHMANCEVAERHRRGERQAGLITDAVLGRGRDIAGSVQAGDRTAPLMNDLSATVRQKTNRSGAGRMQLDAVEWRLLDGPERRVGSSSRLGRGELPLILAAVEILVLTALREAVEAL